MKKRMCALRGRGGKPGEKDSWHLRLELGEEDVSNTIDSVQKDYMLVERIPFDDYNGHIPSGTDVVGAVTTTWGHLALRNGWKLIEKDMAKRYRIRKLTSRECFRLMDVKDEDIDKIKATGISESQQYKLAGNSIVVAVLEGIFTQMFREDSDALF